MSRVLYLGWFLWWLAASDASVLTKQFVQNNDARCLDGSRAAYYSRVSSNSSTWVIYLEDGGVFCYDGETCAEHVRSAPYFATSNEPFRPGQLRGYTLFSDDAMESPFAGANFLFVPYCSSDGWLLDDLRLLSDTFYVRGAVILQSILSEVLSGIEYRNATTLVLAGSSAGALGVVNHLAYVTNTLGFPAANVMMILDSWSAPLPLFETSEMVEAVLRDRSHWTANSSAAVWLKQSPCLVSLDCLVERGYVPNDIKTLVITSSYDRVLFYFSVELASPRSRPSLAAMATSFAAQAGAVNEAAVNAYSHRGRTTVFVTSCIHHLYITPIDPAYRSLQPHWQPDEVAMYLAHAQQRAQLATTLHGFAVLWSQYGPFRWFSPNFGASQFTRQYAAGQPLGALVRIWAQPESTPDVVGSLCLDAPNCDARCSDEGLDVLPPDTDASLFEAALILGGGGAMLLLTVLVLLVMVDHFTRATVAVKGGGDVDATSPLPFNLRDFKALTLMARHRRRNDRLARMTTVTHFRCPLDTAAARHILTTKFLPLLRRWQRNRALEVSVNAMSLSGHLQRCADAVALRWAAVCYRPTTAADAPLLLRNTWGQFHFGRFTCVLGASGGGKSSLLMLLAGRKKRGTFSGVVERHALLRCQALLTGGRDISVVYQHESGAFPRLSVEDNLYFRLRLVRRTLCDDGQGALRQEVDALLKRTGLIAQRQSLVETLSGGQRKRLAIGLQLVMNDPVLFLDEPTSGLDGTSSLEIATLLRTEAATYSRCVVAVLHQPRNEILTLVDDLLVLKAGRTLYCGSCATFLRKVLPRLAPIDTDAMGDRIVDHISRYDDFDVLDGCRSSDHRCDGESSDHDDTSDHDDNDDSGSGDIECGIRRSASISAKDFERRMWRKRQRSRLSLQAATAVAQMATNTDVDGGGRGRYSAAEVFAVANALFSTTAMRRAQRHLGAALWREGYLLESSGSVSLGVLRRLAQQHSGRCDGSRTVAVATTVMPPSLVQRVVASAAVVGVLVQRQVRALGGLRGMTTTAMTTAIVYPLVALFFLAGRSWLDVINTAMLTAFIPNFMTLLLLSVDINGHVELVFLELSDGVYAYGELLSALLWTFSGSALVIQAIGTLAVLLVRVEVSMAELWSVWVMQGLNAIFAVAVMILIAIWLDHGSQASKAVQVTSTIFVILAIFSGVPFSIFKLPEALRWVMATNPLYVQSAAVFYVTLPACTWAGSEPLLCRAAAFSLWGYADYNDRGRGAFLIMAWTLLVITLTCAMLYYTIHVQRSVTETKQPLRSASTKGGDTVTPPRQLWSSTDSGSSCDDASRWQRKQQLYDYNASRNMKKGSAKVYALQ